jgi:hypothetical protein
MFSWYSLIRKLVQDALSAEILNESAKEMLAKLADVIDMKNIVTV